MGGRFGLTARRVRVAALAVATFVVPSLALAGSPASGLGACTIRWTAPTGGAWETAANWTPPRVPTSTDIACVDDGNAATSLVVTVSSGNVLGLDNGETISVDPSGSVFLQSAGEIRNRGSWLLGSGSSVIGFGSAAGERFVNSGSLVKSGALASVLSSVRLDSTGTVSVADSDLFVDAGAMPATVFAVTAPAALRLNLDATRSAPSGAWSSTGTGTVVLSGTAKPPAAWSLGFAAGALASVSLTVDTSVAPVTNLGVLPVSSLSVVGPGFANVGSLVEDSSGAVVLTDGVSVTNSGSWSLGSGSSVIGFGSAAGERFVNSGSLVKSGALASVLSSVRLDSTGTVSVADSDLFVDAGAMPATVFAVTAPAALRLNLDATRSAPSGAWSSTGTGTVVLSGTAKPPAAWSLGFAAGALASVSLTVDTSVAPVTNLGVLPVSSLSVVGPGFANVGSLVEDSSGAVVLTDGVSVTNSGSWSLGSGSSVIGFGSAAGERFVNSGSLVKSGALTSVLSSVWFDSTGTVSVSEGDLWVSSPGVMPDAVFAVSAPAVVHVPLTAASRPSGTWSSTGTGTVDLSGIVAPVAPLTLNYAAGRLTTGNLSVVTSVATVTNRGVLPVSSLSVTGSGFANVGSLVEDPSGAVVLTDAASVTNSGSWSLGSGSSVIGFGSASGERFVNSGSLVKSGALASFLNSVLLDNTGTVSTVDSALNVNLPVAQASGGTLTGGTWRAAGTTLSLSGTPSITAIGAGTTIVLDGVGASIPQLADLASNAGSLTLTNGADLTTTAAVTNTGTLRVGPQSTFRSDASFATTGTVVFDLAGAPGTGNYGDVRAAGTGSLGGTAQIVVAPTYTPVRADVFGLGTFGSLTGTFGSVLGAGASLAARYTGTQFLLNGVGLPPIPNAGPDITVDEATPATVVTLNGAGSTDPDGTIVSYRWTTTPSVPLTGANTATPTFLAADDASFVATLEVCDNDGQCFSDSATVVVRDVAPIATATVPAAGLVGVPVTITASFADPGALDTHTGRVLWGDGAIDDLGTVTRAPRTVTHTYATPGSYSVTYCVTDNANVVGCAPFQSITVTTPVPIAVTGGPYAVIEGSTITLDGRGSSVGLGGTASYSWAPAARLTGATTATPTFAAVDDETLPVTLTVCDGLVPLQCATSSTTVTVLNAAPVLSHGTDRTINAGDTLSISVPFTDAGVADTHTATIDWGEGPLDLRGAVTSPVVASHVYATGGTRSLQVCVTDDNGGRGCDATVVTVRAANQLPVARITAPSTMTEGSTVPLSGLSSSDADGSVATYGWTTSAGTLSNPTSVSPTLTVPDNTTVTLTLTVVDDLGASSAVQTATITVTNVAPTVTPGTTPTGRVGVPVTVSATFTDPSPVDTFTATIDWGDGSAVANVGSVASPLSRTHAYGAAGSYTARVCVTDDDNGGPVCVTVPITIDNVPNLPPVAVIAAPSTVDEGSTASFSGAGSSDPDGTVVSYAWTVTPAAAGTLSGANTATPTFAALDDATATITLRVTDNAGAFTDATRTVVVANVQPTVNAGADRNLTEGDTLSLSVGFTDPGIVDTHTATIDWGDGSAPSALGTVTSPFGATHAYAVPGTYTLRACVADDDNPVGVCDPVIVRVNARPVAVIVAPTTMTEGSTVALSAATSTDADGSIATYGWTSSIPGSLSDPTSPTPTLTVLDNATVTLTLTVVDDKGASSAVRTATVVVTNVAPTPDAGPNLTATVGVPVSLTATIADPSPVDTFGASIDWGDGVNDNLGPVARSFTRTHTYAAVGTYTATVCAIDDDSGTGCDTTTVTVSTVANQRPVAVIGSVPSVIEGNSMVLFGDGSTDADGTIVSYLWSVTGPATLVDPAAKNAELRGLDDGPVAVTLTVTDDRGAQAVATKTVTVTNFLPLVVAPADRTVAQRTPVSFTTTFFDAGTLDTHTAKVDWRDGTPVQNLGTVLGAGFGASHTYATAGTYDVVITVTDDDGGEGIVGLRVTVTPVNQPPVASISTLATVAEGSSISPSGSSSSDADGTVASYAWTVSGGALTGANTATPTFTSDDNRTVTLTLTVTDNLGATGTATTTITVTNVAPTPDAGADRGVLLGTALTLSTSFTDPGTADTHRATVDWGDGTAIVNLATVTSPFTASHTYATVGTYTANVCVIDDDGGSNCDPVVVTVAAVTNPAPTAVISGPTTVPEGAPIALSGTGSTDPNGTVTSYAWTVSGGALIGANTATPTFTSDDNRTVTVTLTVTDDQGATGTATMTITVVNVAPTTNAGPDRTLAAGTALTLSTSFTDPGTADTYRATIDWGDGTPVVSLASVISPFSAVHTYAVAGTYTANVCVIDDDGGANCDPVVVLVTGGPVNIPPSAVIVPSVTKTTEGSTVTLASTGSNDPDGRIVSYRWSTTVGTLSSASSSNATLRYNDNAIATVTLQVTDNKGVSTTTTATIEFTNVAPNPNAGADQSVLIGRTVSIRTSFTDPGSLDTHRATVDWGDGSARESVVTATSPFTAGPHRYSSAGTFTAKVCVIDDDDGSGCDSIVVTVRLPRLDVSSVRAQEGAVASVTFTLDASSPTDVVVSYATHDGTALAGAHQYVPGGDYVARASSVRIPAGSTTATVRIATTDDLLKEPNETFTVLVTAAPGTVLGTNPGTVTIVDDGDVCTIVGTAGDDTLVGTPGADHLCGLAGDDVLDGAGGNDVIEGGPGRDRVTYLGSPRAVNVNLSTGVASGWGTDSLDSIEEAVGSAFADTITGSAGDDWLSGAGGDDTIDGRAGNDTVLGGDGIDTLTGGDGDDLVLGGFGDDVLHGNAGNDNVQGQDGDDLILGDGGDDVLSGGAGNDTIRGGAGNDILGGGAGNDLLYGGAGDDRLDGGTGVNVLDGGPGVNICSAGPPGEKQTACSPAP